MGRLHRGVFEEIIRREGTDAAIALAYMASTLRKYYKYSHAQIRRKYDGKYWEILRQALGGDSMAGISRLETPYPIGLTGPPSGHNRQGFELCTVLGDDIWVNCLE